MTRTLVMDTVEQLDFRVTLGDVAANTGLTLSEAKQELLSLAQVAGGHLHVTDQGDIAYVFTPRFRQILAAKLQQDRWTRWRRKLWNWFLYGFRISFGIFMIIEFVIIVVAIIALMTASRGENNDSRDNDRGGGFNMFLVPNLWFGNPFWSPVYYWDDYDDRDYRSREIQSRRSRQRRDRDTQNMNFLEAVYSLLFGDGNPNADLDQHRYQLIGNLIRQHQGVITGEQVLPYLDIDPSSDQLEYEDYMLPILVRFDGQPEVSEAGDIVYRFPELQIAAAERRQRRIPSVLEEKLWSFSQAPSGQLTLAGIFAAANFLGSWFLFLAISPQSLAAAGVGFVSNLMGLLVLYGTFCLIVPGIRWFTLQWRNQRVTQRNQQRQTWHTQLEDPSEDLQRKLEFADSLADETIVDPSRTIYSTDEDLMEQRDYDLDRPEFQRF